MPSSGLNGLPVSRCSHRVANLKHRDYTGIDIGIKLASEQDSIAPSESPASLRESLSFNRTNPVESAPDLVVVVLGSCSSPDGVSALLGLPHSSSHYCSSRRLVLLLEQASASVHVPVCASGAGSIT